MKNLMSIAFLLITFASPITAQSDKPKISINTATQAELESLTRIGPSLAIKIIKGRPYLKLEDIMKVNGIKAKTFETIKPFITL